MKESRVDKFKDYRDSISKEGKKSKSFKSPKNQENISSEMQLYLEMQHKNTVVNVFLLSIVVVILILLIVFGIKVF